MIKLQASVFRFGITTTQRRSFQSLPVINIQPFLNGSKNINQIIKQLDEASRNVGFFYIEGHGISPSLVEDSINISREFFNLPLEEKNKISINNSQCYRGYQKLGQNITQGKRDWHEAIDLYSEQGVDENYRYNPAKPIHGPNQWPQYPPNFRLVIERYIKEMRNLGSQLMRIVALALDQDIDFFLQTIQIMVSGM